MVKFKVGHKVKILEEETENQIFDIFFNNYDGENFHSVVFPEFWTVIDVDAGDEIYTCECASLDGSVVIDADFIEEELDFYEVPRAKYDIVPELEIVAVDLSKTDLTVDDYLDLVNLYGTLGDQESKQYYLDKLASL